MKPGSLNPDLIDWRVALRSFSLGISQPMATLTSRIPTFLEHQIMMERET